MIHTTPESSGNYYLDIYPDPRSSPPKEMRSPERTDINELLVFLLKDVEGIEVRKT